MSTQKEEARRLTPAAVYAGINAQVVDTTAAA